MEQPNQTASTLLSILEQQPFFRTIKITQAEREYRDKYPHIDITLDEIFDEIQKLKHRKDHALKMNRLVQNFPNWSVQQYYQKVIERMETMMQAKGISGSYTVEEGKNLELIGFFCYYFAADQDGLLQHAEENNIFYRTPLAGLSVNKGIMVMGNTGRGKTMLFKAFSQNPRKSYCFVEAKYIRDEYKNKETGNKSGIEVIRHFSTDFESTGRSMYNQNQYELCIDDFGVEEPVNIYGDKTEVILEVLMNRLNANRITHLSTNMTLDEIQVRYGSRLVSRLHEQMNILFFPKEAIDYRRAT